MLSQCVVTLTTNALGILAISPFRSTEFFDAFKMTGCS